MILSGARLPPSTRFACVYVVRDEDETLYVGSTQHGVRNRMRQHLVGRIRFSRALRNAGAVALTWTVGVLPMASVAFARVVEGWMIRGLRPVFNDEGKEEAA